MDFRLLADPTFKVKKLLALRCSEYAAVFTPYHDNGLFANVLQAQFGVSTKAWLNQDVVLCSNCILMKKQFFLMIGTSAMIEYDWVGIEKVLQYCYIVGIYALVRRTVCEDYSGQHKNWNLPFWCFSGCRSVMHFF